MDGWPDSVPDGTWDVTDLATEDAPEAPDTLDAADESGDPGLDGSDPVIDMDVDPDPDPEMDPDPDPDPDLDPDPLPDTIDGPCSGTVYGGCCWYLGGGTHPSCTNVCSTHGGYDICTRTFAGSDGTNANCDAVLTALGIPSPGTTSTLIGSGSGVGCFYMDVAGARYWVSDTPTSAGSTYTLARRACACTN